MSAADIIDEDAIELPDNLHAELDSCRRLVAAARKDPGPALQRGAACVFRTVTKDTPELFRIAVDSLYEIATAAGMTNDDATQKILDDAITDAATSSTAYEDDPTIQAWERNDPRTAQQANGHDAAPAPSPDKTDSTNKKTAPTGTALVAFPLVAFKDIHLDTTQRHYLIKNVLPRRGLAVIWGPPKCYKSFIATDMGLHVALDWYYRGYRVQQAPVIYIALEGREGQAARAAAFRQYHDIADAPFYLITVPLDLLRQHRELIASIEAQLGKIHPGAVFIDTLNRSLVGSESKDEDMARYLAAAGAIEEKFKCLVAIVHHCGIDRDRPRGHTSLSAAVEVQLRVDRIDDLQATVTVELAKDFPEGTEIFYRLEAVNVGTDPDGDPIMSLVVLSPEEAGSPPERRKATKGLGAEQKNALTALTECLAQTGIDAPAAFGLPAGIKVVDLEQWRQELFRRDILERGDGKNPASKWSRLKNKLFEKGYIGIRDEKVWRT